MSDFPSRRSVVRAQNAIVATSQPLAASAGLRMLWNGGNAIDAAIAAAAVLNVVEPMGTGIGGDMFALVWMAREQKLYALNGSGRAPNALSIGEVRKRGTLRGMPTMGWLPVTVPGAVDGWAQLLDRFGTMKFADVLPPAIAYAENGFPVSEIIAQAWTNLQPKLDMNPAAARAYLHREEPPRVGQIHKQPDLAKTFRALAQGGRDEFYCGEIADKIAAHAHDTGGFITRDDLSKHTSTWDEPIATTYHDVTLYECPPNGQGIVALETLNVLEGFVLREMEHNSPEYLHLIVEALKLAFADAFAHVADPRVAAVPTTQLLDKTYAAQRRAFIDPAHAMEMPHTGIQGSDTIYLTVVDKDRNCVSFINSLFEGFGSGIVVPGTGICLQNRGANFSLDPRSPNALAPNKRPYHTIIPAMAFKRDAVGRNVPWLSFGVMGDFMQPQGHVQVLLNLQDFNMDPQRALDAPRVRVFGDGAVALEDAFDNDSRVALTARGHKLVESEADEFGGGQIILLDPETGALAAGSDSRKDGAAVGY
ncbi:MAG: gamma-glutamyltransferase [Chloroflexi bacterium]|nr:gamma-glutamyltransferase [Chloroflexota bacterium]